MRFPRIERLRGRSLKFYFVVIAFGVASGYYINKPIYEELERRRSKEQIETALKDIEAAAKLTAKTGE